MRPKAIALFVVSLFFLAFAMTASAQTQARQFRVTSPTANIRPQPSTNNQPIGKAHAGDVLTVVAVSGDWVEVSLPSQDGFKREGYIYLNLGSMEFAPASAPAKAKDDAVPAVLETKPAAPAKDPARTDAPATKKMSAEKSVEKQAPIRPAEKPKKATAQLPAAIYGVPHTFGIGAQVGGFTFGLGANVRYWSNGRLGFQVGISHYGVGFTDNTDPFITVAAHGGVLQFAPSVLYRFGNSKPDPDDTTAIEPYAGGGLNIFHSTASATASDTLGLGISQSGSESATNLGFQGFVGVELFLKSMPKLGLGGDLGYYSSSVPFAGGFKVGGFAYSFSAHWYMK